MCKKLAYSMPKAVTNRELICINLRLKKTHPELIAVRDKNDHRKIYICEV